MNAAPAGDLCILVAFPWMPQETNRQLVDRAARIIDKHTLTHSRPVTWLASVLDVTQLANEETVQGVTILSERRKRCGDTAISCGFSGAPHSTLLNAELQAELKWSGGGPPGYRIPALLAFEPGVIIPRLTDPQRTGSVAAEYAGFWAAGVQRSASEESALLFHSRDGGQALLPMWEPGPFSTEPAGLAKHKRKLQKKARKQLGGKEEALLLYVPLNEEADAERLALLLDIVEEIDARRKKKLTFTALTKSTISEHITEAAGDESTLSPLQGPGIPLEVRGAGYAAGALRTGRRQTQRELAEVLEIACGHRERENDANGPRWTAVRAESRVHVAAMTGQALLADTDFHAAFSGGQLTGIIVGQTNLLAGLPSTARLVSRESETYGVPETAFSFEDGTIRGLSTGAALSDPRAETSGALWIDYFFAEDIPSLLADYRVTHPYLRGERAPVFYTPIEVPLALLADGTEISVTAVRPDKSTDRVTLSSASPPGIRYVAGGSFLLELPDGTLSFSVAEPKPRTAVIQAALQLREHGHKLLASFHPLGCYQGRAALTAVPLRERLLVAITASAHLPELDRELPAPLTDEIPRPFIERA